MIRAYEQHQAYKYNTQRRFNEFYENPQTNYVNPTNSDRDTYDAIINEIKKNPPNSRGDISVGWKEGGGHSMVWELDSDRNVHIIDTQSSGAGRIDEVNFRTMCYSIDNTGTKRNTCSITRTDNLKLKKGITNICKNSTGNNNYVSETSVGETNKEQYPVLNEMEAVKRGNRR